MSPSVTWDMEKKIMQENALNRRDSNTQSQLSSSELYSPVRKSSLKKQSSQVGSSTGRGVHSRHAPNRLYSADTLPGAP